MRSIAKSIWQRQEMTRCILPDISRTTPTGPARSGKTAPPLTVSNNEYPEPWPHQRPGISEKAKRGKQVFPLKRDKTGHAQQGNDEQVRHRGRQNHAHSSYIKTLETDSSGEIPL